MCYMTLLSTTSDANLTLGNNDLVRFSQTLPGIPEEIYLRFKNKWYIGSQSGCSCEFRHLYIGSVELGFGLPEDWYPEGPHQIEATLQVIATIRSLVDSGESVECIDAWAHGEAAPTAIAGEIEVNLSELSDEAFRFFENHRFSFV